MQSLNVLHNRDSLSEHTSTEPHQYLTFQLSGETFGIPILGTREILEYSKPTYVPLMPNFIQGVMNLRGTVVPVIDLSLRFARQAISISRRTCIVIIDIHNETHRQLIGILVDTVHEVLAIPDTDIEPTPQFGNKIRADFIYGMAKVNSHFIILLNIDKALSIDDLALLSNLNLA